MGRRGRVVRPLLALLLVTAVTGPTALAAPVTYMPPVDGAVLRGFEPPAGGYGPGHRGVDLDAVPGQPVAAAAAGEVVHAGPVVGIVWVSLDHADGIRTSYGPLTELRVRAGDLVEGGAVLGHLAAGGHGHGHRDRGLHVGARRDGDYIDPLLLFGSLRPSLDGGVRHGRAPAEVVVPDGAPVAAMTPRPRAATVGVPAVP
jgi:murein DD-endopeptidase MepM/ murein hydrolase activator NlpD